MAQDTMSRNFISLFFTSFRIVLHVLKFSFVSICCHGNQVFQLVIESRNEQSPLDPNGMILARLHSDLVINQKSIKNTYVDVIMT